MIENFKERCEVAEKCLPESGYKDCLVNLHKEMLAEYERLKKAVKANTDCVCGLLQCNECPR